MKNPPMLHRQDSLKNPGFALVISLVMLVLLTVIAVGMLSLSAITLRTASQGEAMAIARGNAKLAMLIAIGELQRTAGPDQRITAPASLRDSSASPAITGVWQSWKPDVDDTDYNAKKSSNFVSWLASGAPANQSPSPDNPPGSASAGATGSVTVLSDRPGASGGVTRGVHLRPTTVDSRGSMAWTVIDEGVKARIDLPTESTLAADTRAARLRAPARPQPEAISATLDGLRMDHNTAPKLISFSQGNLQLGDRQALAPYLHDLTPHAQSLMTNVADGGLKADLTRAFEDTLPGELSGIHLYSNTSSPLVPADPRFNTLAQYYNLYKQTNDQLQLSVPDRYRPVISGRPNLAPPDGMVIAPVVTNVSVTFSLMSQLAHANWATTVPQQGGSDFNRMIYLIYTPTVTVYNPYSRPLTFSDLRVTFRNLPVGFKFFRNGQPLTNEMVPLNAFRVNSGPDFNDEFSITTGPAPGRSGAVTLSPGEARVFGISQPTTAAFGDLFNWTNTSKTHSNARLFTGSGWDYRSGFILDWLLPTHYGRTPTALNLGVIGAKITDTINVEVGPIVPVNSGGKLAIEFEAMVGRRSTQLGIYDYNYRNLATLDRVLRDSTDSGGRRSPFPFRMERNVMVQDITIPQGAPHTQWGTRPRPFAMFSLTARTANDSLYPGKPGITSSFVHSVLDMDVSRHHPALLPMEMQLRPITGSGANVAGSIDADEADRAFYFSGMSRGTGAISFVSLDIPRSPLVNLADLRHAHLTNSGYLPLTQSTIGESLASPYVPSTRAIETNSVFGYAVPDHSWHANRNLWDTFFFSGIRNAGDATRLFNETGVPLNPRLAPLPPAGTTSEQAATRATAGDAWQSLASMVALRGGFNVNSTSVEAWKAMLSSLRGAEIPVLGPVEINVPPANARQQVINAVNAAFPRQSRPIAGRVDASNSHDNTRRWAGFRELDETEIDRLAREIVREIRDRGPFLSMAEFVNRRIGSGDFATAGALEAAIRRSRINDDILPAGTRYFTADQAREFGFANPDAAAGSVEEGAAGLLTQGDLLSVIGAQITVRSDTFVIRTYGDARSGNTITARAWCEAVVQRVPDFVDPTDAPDKVRPLDANGIDSLTTANRKFGRRFEIVSFRWLHQDEV